MTFQQNAFAMAASATFGIMYLLCAVVVALWPDFALQLLGWLAHVVNVDKFAGDVRFTMTGVFVGLIEVLLYVYVSAWIFASLYNRFVTRTPS